MTKVLMNIVEKGDNATLYTITFEGNDMSEFRKFREKFQKHARLQRDYLIIMKAVTKILENGALERYFRYEGKASDHVVALPIDSGKLRLYCLRLSDKILIAGNGGVKKTAKYNDDEELSGYVIDLQEFDNILSVSLKSGAITIEEMEIGIDNKTF